MSDRPLEPVNSPPGEVPGSEVPVDRPATSPETASLLALIDRLGSLLERSDLDELEVEAGETGIVLRKPAALITVATTSSLNPTGAGTDAAAGAPGRRAGPPLRRWSPSPPRGTSGRR